MTEKKTEKPAKKTTAQKFTLIELVNEADVHYPALVMVLAEAGLLEQYYQEAQDYGRLDIKPTITRAQFTKIINKVK